MILALTTALGTQARARGEDHDVRKIDTIVIHHSASHEGSVGAFTVEHIDRGFGGIGYHAIIGNGHGAPDGDVRQGRPDAEKGCGVFGANTGKLHICLVGQFSQQCASPPYAPPTSAQLRSLGLWLISKVRVYRVSFTHVQGHREVAIKGHGTLCPGDLDLKGIRQWLLLWEQGKGPMAGPLDKFLADKSSDGVSPSQATPGPVHVVPAQTVPVVTASRLGVNTDIRTHLNADELWVPVKDLVLALGGTIEWNSGTGRATVTIEPPTPPPSA